MDALLVAQVRMAAWHGVSWVLRSSDGFGVIGDTAGIIVAIIGPVPLAAVCWTSACWRRCWRCSRGGPAAQPS